MSEAEFIKKCKQCSFDNPFWAKYCGHCGIEFKDDKVNDVQNYIRKIKEIESYFNDTIPEPLETSVDIEDKNQVPQSNDDEPKPSSAVYLSSKERGQFNFPSIEDQQRFMTEKPIHKSLFIGFYTVLFLCVLVPLSLALIPSLTKDSKVVSTTLESHQPFVMPLNIQKFVPVELPKEVNPTSYEEIKYLPYKWISVDFSDAFYTGKEVQMELTLDASGTYVWIVSEFLGDHRSIVRYTGNWHIQGDYGNRMIMSVDVAERDGTALNLREDQKKQIFLFKVVVENRSLLMRKEEMTEIYYDFTLAS